MKIYSLYDADGRVFSVVSLQQQDLITDLASLNQASGHVEGSVDGDTHYVRDGRSCRDWKIRPFCKAGF